MRVKRLAAPVEVEPPRNGEDAAECVACGTPDDAYIWVSERWRVRAMDRPTGLPMVLILECRSHLDLGDLPNLLAAELGVMTVRLERAIRSLDGVARVHVNRWGDGSAHLHLWFLARPYGRLQLRGTFLSLWDDILPVIPEPQWRENLALVAAWLAEFGGTAIAEPPHIQWEAPSTITYSPDAETHTGPAAGSADGGVFDSGSVADSGATLGTGAGSSHPSGAGVATSANGVDLADGSGVAATGADRGSVDGGSGVTNGASSVGGIGSTSPGGAGPVNELGPGGSGAASAANGVAAASPEGASAAGGVSGGVDAVDGVAAGSSGGVGEADGVAAGSSGGVGVGDGVVADLRAGVGAGGGVAADSPAGVGAADGVVADSPGVADSLGGLGSLGGSGADGAAEGVAAGGVGAGTASDSGRSSAEGPGGGGNVDGAGKELGVGPAVRTGDGSAGREHTDDRRPSTLGDIEAGKPQLGTEPAKPAPTARNGALPEQRPPKQPQATT
jgi:hypothetical protein